MVPLHFGAHVTSSLIQSSSLKAYPPGVSNTHSPVRFSGGNDPQITPFNELGKKGIYKPPRTLTDWLDRQENPSKVMTLKDLSKKTRRDRYGESPEGQEWLRHVLENRERDLARSNIGPYRTALVQLLGESPNVTDKELLRASITSVIKNNPGISPKRLKEFISILFMYEKDPSFASPGTRLGNQGDPPSHASLVIAEKPSTAHNETRTAWTRALSAWNRKTNKNLRQPKGTILDHGELLEPVLDNSNAFRTLRISHKDLPRFSLRFLLEGLHTQYPPSLTYRLGLRDYRTNAQRFFHNGFRIIKPVATKQKSPVHDNKTSKALPENAIRPSLPSQVSFPFPSPQVSSERRALRDVSGINRSEPLSPNFRRTSSTFQPSTLKRGESTLTGSKESSSTNPSKSVRRNPRGAYKSHRPPLIRSASTTVATLAKLAAIKRGRIPALPFHKSF